jgi:D-arginine dehydrogenase
MNQPDVVIVGGGIIGASVAYQLAATHRVLLIEQGSQPGLEATAQNAGLLRRMGDEPTERALAQQTFDFLTRFPHKQFVAYLRSAVARHAFDRMREGDVIYYVD